MARTKGCTIRGLERKPNRCYLLDSTTGLSDQAIAAKNHLNHNTVILCRHIDGRR